MLEIVLKNTIPRKVYPFLKGWGEMGELTRNYDWASTPLGPPEEWPASLRVTVSNMLNSGFPMFLWWGTDMIQFYNDAYRPSLGNEGKHPMALGQPGKECWPEIWHIIQPLIEQVQTTGEATWQEDQLIPIFRNGKLEDVYWTYSYSPVLDEAGKHAGILVTCVETTDNVLTNERIANSEQNLRNIILQAPVAMCILSGNDHVVEIANDRMFELWGKPASMFLGKSIFEGLPEVKGQGFEQLLAEVFETGKTYSAYGVPVQLPRDHKTETVYINFVYEPFRDNDQIITGIMVVATDVTEQVLANKKTEEALQKIKETEEKARLAIESAALGTYEMNYQEDGLVSSTRLNEIFGKAQISTRHDYVSAIHPDDEALRKKAHEASLKTGNLNYEARILVNDETRWIRASGKVTFDSRHQPQRLIGVVQDITEQKSFAEELGRQVRERTAELEQARLTLQESFNYLQTIINKFESGLVSLVPIFENGTIVDFTIKLTNHAFTTYSRLPPEIVQGKKLSEVFPGYKDSGAFEKYVETYQTGKINKWDLHYHFDNLDVHLTVTASKMNEELIVNFTDFTNLKSLQSDLLQNIEALQRSNKNLEDFAYAASHDLKEPIRKIHFFADMLKNEVFPHLNSGQVNLFEKLIKATTRMGTLVDDLLAYSQVNNRLTVTENIDMNKLVETVLGDLEYEIVQKQATIQVSKLFKFSGHQRQLQQAFQNLIGNSLKYAKPGEPVHITIDYAKIKGLDTGLLVGGEQLQQNFHLVTISDNGIGFDQEDAERIFNVFTRLHGNTQYQGTGIGLATVRKVISNHHGYIVAEGNAEGAVFKIYLPA